MYTMWWHKPLSPKEPFVIKGPWAEALCAYMFILSEMSGEVAENSLESQTIIKTMFAFLRLYSKTPEIENLSLSDAGQCCDAIPTIQISRSNSNATMVDAHPETRDVGLGHLPSHEAKPVRALRLASKASLEELKSGKTEKTATTAFFERRPKVRCATLGARMKSDITLRRWNLATSAIQQYPVLLDEHAAYRHHASSCVHLRNEELIVRRVQNWPWDDLLREVGGLVVGLILWLANFAYGAIHAAAWNDHFPTPTEKWLWRSSSVYIGFCGGLWIVLNYVAKAYRPLNDFWEKWMDGGGKRWQNVILSVPVIFCGFSLIFARGFIVIEAFLSIRSLPASAYDTPNWSQIFPHL